MIYELYTIDVCFDDRFVSYLAQSSKTGKMMDSNDLPHSLQPYRDDTVQSNSKPMKDVVTGETVCMATLCPDATNYNRGKCEAGTLTEMSIEDDYISKSRLDDVREGQASTIEVNTLGSRNSVEYDDGIDGAELDFTAVATLKECYPPTKSVVNRCKTFEKVTEMRESWIEVTIIDDIDDLGKADGYKLDEILYVLQSLKNFQIKENIEEELLSLQIDRISFGDLNLGCMTKENEMCRSLFDGNTGTLDVLVEKVFRKSLLAYYKALRFLAYVDQHTVNRDTKALLHNGRAQLQNVFMVVKRAIELNQWPVPELQTTQDSVKRFVASLPHLMDEYLKCDGSRDSGELSELELSSYQKQLIINYEIVSEVDFTLSCLNEVMCKLETKVLEMRY